MSESTDTSIIAALRQFAGVLRCDASMKPKAPMLCIGAFGLVETWGLEPFVYMQESLIYQGFEEVVYEFMYERVN